MESLLDSLLQLIQALWAVVSSLFWLALPWLPLIAWVAYWLFAVNWVKLRSVLLAGGWIGVLLIGLVMILVWGSVAPPDTADGMHHLFGLRLSNFVGKTVYVTGLFSIMFLCGAVQLTGCCDRCCNFPADEPEDDHHAAPSAAH